MRDNKIDFLRFIGLSMIILAHVGPPAMLFQIRNFDVPLMVLVSGMSFGIAYRYESYLRYFWKRIKRLVFPVWLFLTIYFVSVFLFRPSAEDLSLEKLLSSYFLISGIGYVWIIRVFLLVALLAPFIYLISKKTESSSKYLLLLLAIFMIYELCRYFSMPYIEEGIGKNLSLIFYYMIPYSLLFALGLRIPRLKVKTNSGLLLFFTVCFIGINAYFWDITGEFVPTQKYKYPPSIYYFSYAIAVSMLLWVAADKILNLLSKRKIIINTILFIAQNSIWIYLWHIPLVKALNLDYSTKYFVVYTVAICVTFTQVWFVNKYLIPAFSNERARKNLKMVLTG